MIDLSRVHIVTQKGGSDYGRFVIEPLEQGYGHTLGNSLRRVLLASLPGAAITSVKIAGVTHQYTTLEGMTEDIVEFVLSLKKVRLQLTGKETAKLSLSARGPGNVTAGDIKTSTEAAVINKDLPLATLDKGGKLEVEMTAAAGTGYSPAEERQESEVGVIPIDALFNPVIRVHYAIDTTRVGRITNFDKLTLEIYTDGTIEPLAALKQAATILVEHFQVLLGEQAAVTPGETRQPATESGNLDRPIDELDLPVRVINSLKAHGLETIGMLAALTRKELMQVRNLGGKSVELIEKELHVKGAAFKEQL